MTHGRAEREGLCPSQDDVVDMVFTIINNGAPLGDKINSERLSRRP